MQSSNIQKTPVRQLKRKVRTRKMRSTENASPLVSLSTMKMKKRATPTRKGQAPLPSAFFDESKDKVVGDGRKVNNAVRHFIRDDYIRKKVIK